MQINGVEYPVVDVDTHVAELPDVWTSWLPSRWRDRAPTVATDPSNGTEMWLFDGRPVLPATATSYAGWPEPAPMHPRVWSDVDPACFDPQRRVERMDRYGIDVQLLYPNLALFLTADLRSLEEVEFQNAIIRAYNDWLHDWCSAAPDRFLPMASLPFWDLPASIAELERCNDRSFRGLIFTQDPSAFGLPTLDHPHWDPLWARAQEFGMSVNFHIGSGGFEDSADAMVGEHSMGLHTNFAFTSVLNFLANARTVAHVIAGGLCHRFPTLDFVSVESGAGYVKYVLEALDWQWLNCGVRQEHPEYDLLPSEYFQRQVYATFWFERASVRHAIEQIGAGNLMFETDFPHPTSMSPGPATPAVDPPDYVRQTLADVADADLRKLLYQNAAKVYRLDTVALERSDRLLAASATG